MKKRIHKLRRSLGVRELILSFGVIGKTKSGAPVIGVKECRYIRRRPIAFPFGSLISLKGSNNDCN